MRELEYTVSFATPAFLGNAEQQAQWRTPPFKALLRQWWRVVKAAGRKPDTVDIHRREGELFGRAADQGTTASQVRLRLDWRGGIASREHWKALKEVAHPEVSRKPGADLYLAYGPVDVGSKLKRDSFIPSGEARTLSVGIPESETGRFKDIAKLAHAFGALGSRCRNGWGSLHFEQGGLSADELMALFDPASSDGRNWLQGFSRDWRQALDTDWVHALGKDDAGLLLWRTPQMKNREDVKNWEDVLKTLAEVKIAFRTQFHFDGGGKHAALCDRQVLAYPVTNHTLDAWGREARSANQVLFKVLPSNGGYVGLVAHFPHGLPTPLEQRLPTGDRPGLNTREQQVWTGVHAVLDDNLTRLP